MKRLLLAIALVLPVVANAQYEQDSIGFRKSLLEMTNANNMHIARAGAHLERSAKLQYYAIGTAVVGGGLICLGASIDVNKEDTSKSERWSEHGNENRAEKIAAFAFGGISLLTSFACEIVAIKRKMDAGRELKLLSGGNSIGVSYLF